jgi:hypothetical protein
VNAPVPVEASAPDTTSKPFVRRVLAEGMPELKQTGLRLVLSTEAFDTWEVAGAVIKFPKDDTHAGVDAELALHDLLCSRLGELIPAVRAVAEPTADFPFRFVAYDKPRGRQGQTIDGPIVRPKPWARTSLAKEAGAALSALHGTPMKAVRAAGVPKRDLDLGGVDPRDETIAWATRVVGHTLDAFLVNPFPAGRPAPGPKVLCHTDLKGEHIFVSEDGTRLTAILDWADMAVCDPAVDLGGLAIWLGPTFVQEVLGFYTGSQDDGLFERAVYQARAGLLDAMDRHTSGEEVISVPVIEAQLRAVFIPPEDPKRRR